MSTSELEHKLAAGQDLRRPRREEIDRRMAEEHVACEWASDISQRLNKENDNE